MKTSTLTAFALGATLTALAAPRFVDAHPAPTAPDEKNPMAEMMAKARKWTQPGAEHKALERFLGKWNTEFTIVGMGGPEKGTAEFSWLMADRWMQCRSRGSMLGQPTESFYVLGYDRFKMSYVTAAVSSADTALLHSEGDMDPSGNVLITYGTLDEYTTGEHDKMVKYVWRFDGKDRIVLEVHDLPIGEKNTKVVEIVYTRAS